MSPGRNWWHLTSLSLSQVLYWVHIFGFVVVIHECSGVGCPSARENDFIRKCHALDMTKGPWIRIRIRNNRLILWASTFALVYSFNYPLLCVDFDLQEGKYAIVTDRWQKFTDVYLDGKILEFLASYADEFLVHGVDDEGKREVFIVIFNFNHRFCHMPSTFKLPWVFRSI